MSRSFAFYAVVQEIPAGRVTTYGEVARAAGFPRCARQVGQALAGLPAETPVPWHRVVSAGGRIAPRPGSERQRLLLQAEGVLCGLDGRIDLARYGWTPEAEFD